MPIITSPKVNFKLSQWSKSSGTIKGKFAQRLSDLFDFILNIVNDNNYKNGYHNRLGSYNEVALKFYKEENNGIIIIHDFDLYKFKFNIKSNAIFKTSPCIIEDKFLQQAKSIATNSEKCFYLVGDLSINVKNGKINFPSVNNLIIDYKYLPLDNARILILNKIVSYNNSTLKRGFEINDNIRYKKLYNFYKSIKEENTELKFDEKLNIDLVKDIPWLSPDDPDLRKLNEDILIKLFELKNCSSIDELLDEFNEINLEPVIKDKLESKLLDYIDKLEKKHLPIFLSPKGLIKVPPDKMEQRDFRDINQSLAYWEELINNRYDQKIIYSSPEQGVIKVFSGPATGKTQLMIIRALKFLYNAINKDEEKHILFITFNNDQSDDIKQRLLNLGCGNYLLNNMNDRIITDPQSGKQSITKKFQKKQTIEVYSLYEWCRDFVKIALKGSIADLEPFEKFRNTKEALETRKKILLDIIISNNKRKNKIYTNEENETLANNCISSIVRFIIPQNIIHKKKFLEIAPFRSKGYRALIWYIYESYRKYLDKKAMIDPEMFVTRSEDIWRDVTFRKLRNLIEYDNLFIDEVQDLLNHQRRLVGQLLKERSQSLMYVGDPNQAVYHTSVFIRNPLGRDTKEFGLNVQLRYTRAIAEFIHKFQSHNSRLEIADDLPLYHQEKENIKILPDIGPSPFIEHVEFRQLLDRISSTILRYLSFGAPDSKITPDDILLIVLPEKNYNIYDSTLTWEDFISKLKKNLKKEGVRSLIFDGSGSFSSSNHVNIVWGAENAKGKEKQVVIVLGADDEYKSAKVSILEDSGLEKNEQELIEYKELKVAISRAQTYLHIQYCYKLHPFLSFNNYG